MNPRAVIFDLDSTLAESKQPMTTEMGEALRDLIEKVPVGVMSGADFPQYVKQLLPNLPLNTKFENLFLFPTSSAESLSYQDGGWKDVYDYLLSQEDRRKIISAFNEATEKTGVITGEAAYGERIEDRGEQITFSALGQEAPLSLKEKWDPDHEKRKKLVKELEHSLPEFNLKIGGMTSVDVSKKGIDKATGIKWLAQKFALRPEEILYVGDALFKGGNDEAAIGTGVETHQVSGPTETLALIKDIVLKLG